MTYKKFLITIALLVISFLPYTVSAEVGPEEARTIAKDAYIYAFSMMENYQTWRKQAVDKSATEYVGGFNRFRHYSEPFNASNHDVVTPNNDTPYSWAWLDLRAEPIVLSVPAVPKDRYYVCQFFDLFTFNFAYVGVRATGYQSGNYLFAGPKWKSEIPKGITKVFRAETEIVGTLTRTQLNGSEDVENVRKIQSELNLIPLHEFEHKAAPVAAPALKFPTYDKSKSASHDFISYLNFFLSLAEPAHPSEITLRDRFAKIGIVPGKQFDASKISPELLSAIDTGVKDAQEEIANKAKATLSSNGIFGSREQLKNDYLIRAVAAEKGLYGNSLEEAWYGGYVGNGQNLNKVHFSKEELPPAKFFWSVTLYSLPDRFLYDNSLNRYSVGDHTKGLKYDSDGGLTLYVGHESPGAEKESNWLPAPAGPFSFVARIYGPSDKAIKGEWTLPPLEPVTTN